MLSERNQLLLSAAVDGEASPSELRTVDRLLKESPEARQLYQELKRNSERLQLARRKSLSPDFPAVVLKRIGDQLARPAKAESAANRYLPVWANAVGAAAVLLAVCAGAYIVMVVNDQKKPVRVAEKNKPDAPEKIA